MKLKNSNCDKTEKTEIVTKQKNRIVKKTKNSNYNKTNLKSQCMEKKKL